eukprot:6509105-Prymnesium_polylepis.1
MVGPRRGDFALFRPLNAHFLSKSCCYRWDLQRTLCVRDHVLETTFPPVVCPCFLIACVPVQHVIEVGIRAVGHRGRAWSRPATGLPAAPDERAQESSLSGLRPSNTW